jgi:hypothetical protein
MKTAAARPEPIPVYAEMSSLNPVFVFEGALAGDVDALAAAYVTAVTGSSGQLCTSPGLLFAPEGEAGDKLAAAVARAVAACSGQTMLTEGIAGSWNAGTEALGKADGVELLGQGTPGPTQNAPAPAIFGTGVDQFISNHVLHEEIFGAASLVIRYKNVQDLLQAAGRIEGQLTASLHLTEADYPTAAPLIPVLEQKVGRIIVNGWPTGVEVGHAMVHGGPFPHDLRGHPRHQPVPPPGRLPEHPPGTAPRGPPGRQSLATQPPHQRRRGSRRRESRGQRMSRQPTIAGVEVVPVAGYDSMLMNLSGAHGPFFTRNVVIITDSDGRTGLGRGSRRRENPHHNRGSRCPHQREAGGTLPLAPA